ncbi:MAG: DUF3568 family protein [Desulfonauticus sp.]|nr:DUF3568 family protein [Desulfonauticus sp.]
MQKLKVYQKLILFMLTLPLSGCVWLAVGGAGGLAGAIYYKGRLEQNVNVYYARLHQASLKTLKELGLPIEKETIKYNESSIESHYLDGTPIWIDIEAVSTHSSKIYIRVGWLGDETRSRDLLNKILAHF